MPASAETRRQGKTNVPLRALSDAPTIERLAVKITDIQMQSEGADEMAPFLANLENFVEAFTHNQAITNRGQDRSGTREATPFRRS